MTYYDDDEDDDFEPEPVLDSEALVQRTIDVIATAPTVPLSSTPRVNRDEILQLLEEALQRMPDELRQARWMLKERQAFIDKTRREADDILDAARAQAERMVQRTEVVRQAETRARHVVEAAETEARRMRLQAEDFCDQRLASFEIILDKLSRVVSGGREKLSGRAAQQQQLAPESEDPSIAFFDQDAL
jgi:cell division septum initiation protein DivIVA